MNNYTLGSLFDGSGGFPLAGCLCGIEPKWAAEVEPYPIAVTRSRFPKMQHLGDISKVNGADIDPVDIITFGSPCQDLSVAGKRAGLKHEANGDEETTRSGLFMEAVRIIKEMRRATNGEYPKMCLWENVPGAFSSNKGEDFRVVLEELIKIVEPSASMPPVPSSGWPYADSYIGDGWSLAYRVFDAQYWGVPQRRRRIHLVLDLRGERAREVLFERDGVRGYFTQGRTPWQAAPGDAQDRPGADDRAGESAGDGRLDAVVPYTLKIRSGCEGGGKGALVQEDKSATLATNNDQYLFQPVEPIYAIDKESWTSGQNFDRAPGVTEGGPCPTLQTSGTVHAVAVPLMFENHSQDTRYKGPLDVAQTVSATYGIGGNNQPFVVTPEPVVYDGAGITSPINASNPSPGDPCHTLSTDSRNLLVATDYKDPQLVAYGLDRASFNQGQNALFDFTILEQQQPTLTARGPGAVACPEEVHEFIADHNADAPHQQDLLQPADGVARSLVASTHGASAHHTKTVINYGTHYIVRRLTPTECARLQGFADRWGDVKAVDEFTQKEYQFWLEVRNTHAAINGKQVKEYTVKQMLTWYNKLQTDSAEYKMWGNGVALPPALYCMQGIVDALNKEDIDDWMN